MTRRSETTGVLGDFEKALPPEIISLSQWVGSGLLIPLETLPEALEIAVFLNNRAASDFALKHKFGDGYGYLLTTTSESGFRSLKDHVNEQVDITTRLTR